MSSKVTHLGLKRSGLPLPRLIEFHSKNRSGQRGFQNTHRSIGVTPICSVLLCRGRAIIGHLTSSYIIQKRGRRVDRAALVPASAWLFPCAMRWDGTDATTVAIDA